MFAGSIFLMSFFVIVVTVLSLYGIYAKRLEKKYWPLFLFLVVSYLFYPLFSGEIRHLQPLIPFLLIFASMGTISIIGRITGERKQLFVYFLSIVLLFSFGFGIISAVRLSINQGQGMSAAKEVSRVIGGNLKDIKTIIYSGHTDFLHYYLSQKNIVAFPSKNLDALKDIISTYNVNCIVFIREKDLSDLVYSEFGLIGANLVYFSNPDPNTFIRIYKI